MSGVARDLLLAGIVVGEALGITASPLLGQGAVGDLAGDAAVSKPVASDVLQSGAGLLGAQKKGEAKTREQPVFGSHGGLIVPEEVKNLKERGVAPTCSE